MQKLTDTQIDTLEDQIRMQAGCILNELCRARKLARRLGQDVEMISKPYLSMLVGHYEQKGKG